MPPSPRAVVLLSGGLDSATAAAIARADGFELYALTVFYGQRHRCEIESARAVAKALGVARHIELPVDLSAFGGSALTDSIDVPKDRPLDATRHPVHLRARRATPCSCRSRWRGRKHWAPVTSSSA